MYGKRHLSNKLIELTFFWNFCDSGNIPIKIQFDEIHENIANKAEERYMRNQIFIHYLTIQKNFHIR